MNTQELNAVLLENSELSPPLLDGAKEAAEIYFRKSGMAMRVHINGILRNRLFTADQLYRFEKVCSAHLEWGKWDCKQLSTVKGKLADLLFNQLDELVVTDARKRAHLIRFFLLPPYREQLANELLTVLMPANLPDTSKRIVSEIKTTYPEHFERALKSFGLDPKEFNHVDQR